MKPLVQFHGVSRAYRALVEGGSIEADAAQQALAERLDRVIDSLRDRKLSSKSSSLGWLFGKRKSEARKADGLYIHGAVGRGKSMLMDLLFEQAPVARKRRSHFNDFMADAHERIAQQRRDFSEGRSKEADPIGPVGRALAAEAELLCFDEFTVTDIADAMILGRLFAVLFERGTVLVATSNVDPDDLYRDGLNRSLFLPFIDLLKRHCDVFRLEARTDFRLEKLARGQAYLTPIGPNTHAAMLSIWEAANEGVRAEPVVLKLKGRTLAPLRSGGRNAWFSFDQLCREPRGATDFLAIANRFDVVFLEGVPVMTASMRNEAKRFILLIDTLYDASVRLIVSAEKPAEQLYPAGRGTEAFEFDRTVSRLIEMQSQDYLGRASAHEARKPVSAEP